MKIQKYITTGILAAAAMALVSTAPRAQAQNQGLGQYGSVQKNTTLEFGFPTTGPSEGIFADPAWVSWYNVGSVNDDATTGYGNNAPGANTANYGSLMVVTPYPATGASQNVFFGGFDDGWGWDDNEQADLTTYASLDFWILVQPGTTLSSSGDFGTIGVGFQDHIGALGYPTIPAAAATRWQHISCPIVQSAIGSTLSQLEGEPCFNVANWGGYPAPGTTFTFWLANITLVALPVNTPPPPPPTMTGPTPAISGLNVITTDNTGANGRQQVMCTNDGVDGNDSFAAQATVTYSFTIKEFPVQDVDAMAANFFIVNGVDTTAAGATPTIPDQYDTAADWNMQNVAFMCVQSSGAGNGGYINFRQKTNAPNSNTGIWGWSVFLKDTNALTGDCTGTWTVTFSSFGTVVTLTGPGGNTVTSNLDGNLAAAFAEANGPSSFLLGSQANNANSTGQSVVFSQFSRTGNHSFTDNFTADSALDATHWMDFGAQPGGVVLVPPTASWWIDWTLPALNFAPVVAPIGTSDWTIVTPITQYSSAGEVWALIPNSSLPSAVAGQFAAEKLTYSKLVVVLPGQSFTTGVAPGYSGTPTAVTGGDSGFAQENISVYAVDSDYNLITSVNDSINITSTDGSCTLPNPESLVSGTLTFSTSNSSFYFGQEGTFTVTATDGTAPNTSITGTSASVVVGP
jgi:hypothetical protein